ncbi:hypothetical protein LOD99_2795 [Oopsacas minuta]|uniref:WH2 domain-containing protein n=1 Tax=Oopsacas minuta TaxID=111878 RepID=A0AAV7K1Z4_9METZ|nr:hypothetical protein LOD99_2795 [Oopsacas minuta]
MASFNGLDNQEEISRDADSDNSDPLEEPEGTTGIPDPPPDMPEDWGDYYFEVERSESASAPESKSEELETKRQALLDNIVQGTQLRHVEVEERQELRTKEGEFVDLRGELSSKMLSKRISDMNKSRNRLVELSQEIISLKEAVLTAQRAGHRHAQLKALVQEIKQFLNNLQQENIPEDALVSQFDWPCSMICTLTNIDQEITTFKDNIDTCVKQEHCIKVNNQRVSNTHLISSLSKLCTSANSINSEETFASMIAYFSIDSDEIAELVVKARLVAVVLLNELVNNSFVLYATALESGLSRIEQNIRVKSAYFTIEQIVKICINLESFLSVPRHPRFSDVNLNAGDLRTLYLSSKTKMPSGKQGPTEFREVELLDTRKNPPSVSLKPQRVSFLQERNKGITEEISKALSDRNTMSLPELLDKCILPNIYTLCEGTLASETIKCENIQMLDIVLAHREKILATDNNVLRKDYTWLFEAFNQKAIVLLSHLVNRHKMRIDIGPVNKEGNTLFYNAARKFDYEMMTHLLELGASPSILTEANTTPLHYLAMKQFGPGTGKEIASSNNNFGNMDFSNYFNNESLSDVILVSSEGKK